jgi:hypothetical protein
MDECLELAGFAAAQVVCCLFDRQSFVPLAFSQRSRDSRAITILDAGNPAEIAARVQEWLDSNPADADDAVVAIDGYLTTVGGRKDAIILEARSYRSAPRRFLMAVPYRPHHDPAGFAIYAPKFIVAALDGLDTSTLMQAFFRGVFSHEMGSRIWAVCADPNWSRAARRDGHSQ